MTVPSLPGTDFVLIQAHFSFCFLKTLLHSPTRAKCHHHLLQRCPGRSKVQHVGHLRRFSSLVQTSSHQQPALPPTNLRCSEFNASPREEARPLGSVLVGRN